MSLVPGARGRRGKGADETMIIHVGKLLGDDGLGEIDAILDGVPWIDGAAGMRDDIKAVKRNRQADRAAAGDALAPADRLIMGAIGQSAQIRNGTFPHRVMRPLYARYGVGAEYGLHTDNPFIGNPESIRADVSCTLFLNGPEDYDGGELVILAPGGEVKVKLPRGAAVVYPTGWHHRVEAVTRGERRVAVTWIQSRVASAERREILSDANGVAHHLHQTAANSPAALTAQRVFNSLMRRWAEGS